MLSLSFPRLLLIPLCAALLGACATKPIEAGARARIQSVGVVSLMDEKVVFERIGTTAFTNAYKTLPTDSLGLHQLGENRIVASLEGRHGKALESERTRVAQTVKLSTMQRLITGGTMNKKAISLEAKRLGAAHAIDTLLILVPAPFQPYGSNTSIWGYTMHQRSLFGNEGTTAFAVQCIEAYDTRTGGKLGYARATNFKDISNAAWRDGSTQETRDCFAELIKKNTEIMLTNLGLRSGNSAIR
ncbi:MAG: hypothetical protein V4710_09670 [Verrucomicrobiota bacterium]